jgi:hypothetical protein
MPKGLDFTNLAGKRVLLPSIFALKSIYCSSVRERDGVSLCYYEVTVEYMLITKARECYLQHHFERSQSESFILPFRSMTSHSPGPPLPARQMFGLVKMTPLQHQKTTFLPLIQGRLVGSNAPRGSSLVGSYPPITSWLIRPRPQISLPMSKVAPAPGEAKGKSD